MVGAHFTLNCTPSTNPPVDTVSIEADRSPVTSGDTVTVTDNILTIPSVQNVYGRGPQLTLVSDGRVTGEHMFV